MTTYPPGFEQAWEAYPHWEYRSTRKLALKVWKRDKLEDNIENVLRWIEVCSRGDDWTKQGGKFVPGMQVWMNQRDFSENPPEVKADPLSPTGRSNVTTIKGWLERSG